MPKLSSSQTTPKPPVPPRDRPLGVNRLDHRISCQNGSTSVLELSPQRLQLAKQSRYHNLTARVEELTKDLGYMRQEIRFYRQSFENLQKLRETCYDVYQQIFLVNYLDPDSERLSELMVQLHHALQLSVENEIKAEKEWMAFWGVDINEKEYEGELI